MKKHAKIMKKGSQNEPKWKQNQSENRKRDPGKPKGVGQSAEKEEAEKVMEKKGTIGASEGAELIRTHQNSSELIGNRITSDGIFYVSVFECY